MQKWEYIHVKVSSYNVVYEVNGQQVAREVKKKGREFPMYEGETFESYLNRAGEEGWELVTNSRDSSGWHTFIFKRPKS
jgi:hypothetical protein